MHTDTSRYTDALRRLKLFNEKAAFLRRSRFVQQVFRKDHGFTMHFHEDRPLETEVRGADEEATLAVAIAFRFFIYKRDGIELEQIADLYGELPVPAEDKRRARTAVDSVRTFLDTPCEFGINGENILRRRILYVFLYGGLAHANEEKRQEYERWMKGSLAPVMQCMFEETIAAVLRVIVSFETMNARTIGLLESLQT